MKKYPTMIFATAIILIGVCGQATAMTAVHTETKATKHTSCCEQIMAWLEECFVHEETSPQHKEPQDTSSLPQHKERQDTSSLDAQDLFSKALTDFKDKKAEKGAVVVCNIDSMLWVIGYSPMREALITLFPFFRKQGYGIVFVTSASETISEFVMDNLSNMGFPSEDFTLYCMPLKNYNRMKRYLEHKRPQLADGVIHQFIINTQAQLIVENHPVAASIDVKSDFLVDRTAGYPILVSTSTT